MTVFREMSEPLSDHDGLTIKLRQESHGIGPVTTDTSTRNPQ
jgi:hypothetical protein